MPGTALALALAAATAAAPAAKAPDPYAPGERTQYAVAFLGIEMGQALLQVGHREGDILPVFLEAKTTGVGKVYDLREQLTSMLVVGSGLPRMASLEAWEGGYHHRDTARFDRAEGVATVHERGKFDNTYEVPVTPHTVEFLGLLFRLRALPLAPGMQHAFSVLQGREVRTVTVDVLSRETLKTPLGAISCLKVRVPTGLAGKFAEKDPTYVWLSDDARRLVVRISTHFAVGRMEVALRAYQPGHALASAAPPAGALARH